MGMVRYFVILLILIPSISWGACTWLGNTCAVSSCHPTNQNSDIQEIKTNALGKTGVVTMQLPPCDEVLASATSASIVNINMSSDFAGITGIVVMGDGAVPSGLGSNGTTKLTNINYLITAKSDKTIRISNITFAGSPYNQYSGTGAHIKISGRTAGFRFDHITWDSAVGKAYYGINGPYGVVDSNYGSCQGQFSSWEDVGTWGNESWHTGAVLGSANAVYFENNELSYITLTEYMMMIADGARGARVVARYNKTNNFYYGGHDFSSNFRSILQYEVYNNNATGTINYYTPLFAHRGGTGVVYSNYFYHNVAQSYKPFANAGLNPIWFRNNRDSVDYKFGICSDTDAKAYLGSGATSWATCTSGATCLDIDGDTGTKYPCRDQIGTGDNLSPQTSKPFLIWNNTAKFSTDEVTTGTAISTSANIVENRDFCQHATTMPATCNGVSTTYTAYTCPHPLTGYTGTCSASVTGPDGYNLDEAADETAPTVLQVYVNGATMTINFSEPITSLADAGFTLDPSGADVTVDCPAVATAATSMACTISRALVQSETATYAYTDTKVIDAAENPLANIGTTAITGNFTPSEAPTSKLTVNKTGSGCSVTSSPSGILASGATASDDFDFNTNTVVTLSGYSENGWNAITYGGDCASNGTVTMSANKTCTATCTQVLLFP